MYNSCYVDIQSTLYTAIKRLSGPDPGFSVGGGVDPFGGGGFGLQRGHFSVKMYA